MQLIYDLSDIYVLKTENGYNAFCLDKLDFKELLDIYANSNRICKDFIKYCTKRKHFTLRMSNDKRILFTLNSSCCIHERSTAHRLFFNMIMGYNISDSYKFDGETVISIDKFLSDKHGVYLDVKGKT